MLTQWTPHNTDYRHHSKLPPGVTDEDIDLFFGDDDDADEDERPDWPEPEEDK